MTQTHTPGPWTWNEYGDLEPVFTLDMVQACGVIAWCDSDNAEANARLIASAPDLLEALEAARIVLAEHEPHPLPVLSKVLIAIAKAKGGDA